MPELRFCHDIYGKISAGPKCRALVVVDDETETATLWLVTKNIMRPELDQEVLALTSISRAQFGGDLAKWLFETERGRISVKPYDCGCGGGMLVYGDITPGHSRVKVLPPDWLYPEVEA